MITPHSQAEALKGYNEGFQQAVENHEFLIQVLFLSQIFQIITYRLIHKSEKDFTEKQLKALKITDSSLFTVGLAVSTLLFLQVLGIPMYNFEVTSP